LLDENSPVTELEERIIWVVSLIFSKVISTFWVCIERIAEFVSGSIACGEEVKFIWVIFSLKAKAGVEKIKKPLTKIATARKENVIKLFINFFLQKMKEQSNILFFILEKIIL
jgi:hypothetical protein